MCAACAPEGRDVPAPGVSRELAEWRASAISDVRYGLTLLVPPSRDTAVTGEVTVRFALSDTTRPLVLDFRAPADHVLEVRLDGDTVTHSIPPDHIVIPAGRAAAGERAVTVRFRATDAALNRNDEFLYALFVPDRASTAFPVFEQPDLKGRLSLTLRVPEGWSAVSNGAIAGTRTAGGELRFAESEPISTYLMTFAAGRLKQERAVRDGRSLTMYHRETDSLKVARNRGAIFDLHAAALKWLETYTGIPYPFQKFEFFAVPAFQFGGMEHPGAVWYRADGLFLDRSASRSQELGRASLIAHETAHMWFGDLVTMRWFDDVWMKEVFANFYAAKIAGPSFPDINLRLRFFQAHHPSAYGVDRTPGANPIRQPLENLRDAGSLYGGIIYQKAPIVMQQLETIVGDSIFREGIRAYLARFRFGNATWPELIRILDDLSPEDLATWSRVWVEEPGRPQIRTRWTEAGLVVRQDDDWSLRVRAAPGSVAPDSARALRWTQAVSFALGLGDSVVVVNGAMRADSMILPAPAGAARPSLVLGGVDGASYGRFVLDSVTHANLLDRIGSLRDPVHRAVAWQTLQEEMLDGRLAPRRLVEAAIREIPRERDELVATQVIGLLRGTYWRFLSPDVRLSFAPQVEAMLWRELDRARTPGRKGTYFGALMSMTLTPGGIARLERIWRKQETPRGLPISEQQYTSLAEGLALRGVPNAEAILDEEAARIANPDRKARFAFVRPALSADTAQRNALFRSFADVANRRRESWVLDAMGIMNHPLRSADALPNLGASLALTEEIQQTGDIFFPLRWLNATLDGHQSPEAVAVVRRYLETEHDLPPRLRGKVLQAADDLFRASALVRPDR